VVFTRSFVLDGNFKLAHVKQKRPDDDVWLGDGHSMMTEQEPYLQHLATAIEIRQVRTIWNDACYCDSPNPSKQPVVGTER